MFFWIYLSNPQEGVHVEDLHPVSILVFLDLPFKQVKVKLTDFDFGKKFQSLFFWIYLSNSVIIRPPLFLVIVSILVFLDLPFKRNTLYIPTKELVKFQSLFFWIYLSNSSILGFMFMNPHLFQSLFFWIYLSNRGAIKMNIYYVMVYIDIEFQSLFFWIYLSNSN